MNTHDYMEQALMTESLPETELTHEQKRLTHASLGLCTEAAELADAVKKHIFYGKPLDKVNLIEEIGDILWYSAIVLDACQSSFDDAMDKNIAKLRKRYPQGIFSASKAIHRDVEAEREVLGGYAFKIDFPTLKTHAHRTIDYYENQLEELRFERDDAMRMLGEQLYQRANEWTNEVSRLLGELNAAHEELSVLKAMKEEAK